jgi:hypothetical protein
MGTFTTKLRVWNPAIPSRVEELEVIVLPHLSDVSA